MKADINNESIWVELIYGREKLIIGDVYKLPNLFRDTVTLLFQEINAAGKYRNVCIIGYFNYRNIDWINIAVDHESDDFINIIKDNFLKQILSEPTREDSILDYLVSNMEIGGTLGSSDHQEIRFKNK